MQHCHEEWYSTTKALLSHAHCTAGMPAALQAAGLGRRLGQCAWDGQSAEPSTTMTGRPGTSPQSVGQGTSLSASQHSKVGVALLIERNTTTDASLHSVGGNHSCSISTRA